MVGSAGFFGVGAFFEGVYGIQRVPKSLCTRVCLGVADAMGIRFR